MLNGLRLIKFPLKVLKRKLFEVGVHASKGQINTDARKVNEVCSKARASKEKIGAHQRLYVSKYVSVSDLCNTEFWSLSSD